MRRFVCLISMLGLCLSVSAWRPAASHASTPQQAATLIANPGFEAGLEPWVACGGAQLVDAQAPGATAAMVHSGRYALRLGNPTGTDCPPPPPGYEYLGKVDQALLQSVTVPADAPGVTVSFWYSITGNASTEVSIILSDNLYTSNYNSSETAYLDRLLYGDQPGWHLFRQVLDPTQLAFVKQLGTLKLQFRINDPLGADENSAFYIDDVQVTADTVTTTASPLPSALQSSGTQPLVYACADPKNPSYSDFICRVDTDGSNARQIFKGYLSSSSDPVWSPNGGTIALIDDNVYPAGETNPDKYVSATALVLVNPDGGAPRTIYQTAGQPGDPALVSKLTNLAWSPDGSTLAAAFFDYQRRSNGTIEGALASIDLIDAATGASSPLLQYATAPGWSATNQVLFETYDLYDNGNRTTHSIWKLDLNQNPPVEQPLIPEPALRYSTDNDFDPVWAPDGQQFVTIRTVSGNHYDADGDNRYNHAMMLTNPQDVTNPRMLLLADNGDIAAPTWSPDGKYIAYTLSRDGKRDIWWLDVASGATGPITKDGLSHNASWRPTSVTRTFLPLLGR